MRIIRNNPNGTHLYRQGKGFIPILAKHDGAFTNTGLGSGVREWPRLTLTISGVVDYGCLVSPVLPTHSHSVTTAGLSEVNGEWCLPRTHQINLPSGAGTTYWLTDDGHPVFWDETDSVSIFNKDPGCGTIDTAHNLHRIVRVSDGIISVHIWASTGGSVTAFDPLKYLFYGQIAQDYLPATIPNEIVTGAYTVAGTSVDVAGGGEAVVDVTGCGADHAAPAATEVSPVQSVSELRDYAEVFELTVSGGTYFDGFYRVVKSNQGGTVGYYRSPYRTREGIGAQVARLTNFWQLEFYRRSARSALLAERIIYRLPAGSSSSEPTESGWVLNSNSAGGTPVLTVRRRNFWPAT